jgi:hypothetical protein
MWFAHVCVYPHQVFITTEHPIAFFRHRYLVCGSGRVYNDRQQQIGHVYKWDTTSRFKVNTWIGKWYRARLVYEAFYGRIPAHMQIDHVDGCCWNDAIMNLQCLTRFDHIQKTSDDYAKGLRRRQKRSFTSAFVHEDEEEWRPLEHVWVSSHGRVKVSEDAVPSSGYRNDKGYLVYRSQKHTLLGVRTVPVHRLVATAFLQNKTDERDQVDHIDKQRGHNHVSNLRWVTGRENTQHSLGVHICVENCITLQKTWYYSIRALRDVYGYTPIMSNQYVHPFARIVEYRSMR